MLIKHNVYNALFISGLLLFLVGVWGCSSQPSSEPISGVSSPVQIHVYESQKLRRMMSELYFDMHTEERSVQEFNEFRSQHAFHLVEALERMSIEIKDVAKEHDGIDANHQEIFNVYALKLREQAEAIRELISQIRTDKLNSAIDKVVEACDGCHRQLNVQ